VSEIQPFVFPATGQPVRTVMIEGEPWFVAVDVAAVLDLGNLHSSLASLDDDERSLHSVERGQRSMSIVSEPGLYSLILRSRKPEAKVFKRWITHEVIPAIRRTGSYSATARYEIPRTYADALRAAADASERAELAEAKVAELGPSAAAWDTLATAEGDYSVRDAAQILDRDPLIKTGQTRLFRKLREFGWIDAEGRPYQAQVDNGRLVRRPTAYVHPHTQEPMLTSQVRITAKGLRELHKRLGGFGANGGLVGAPS